LSEQPTEENSENDHVILAKGLGQEEAMVLVSALEADGIVAFVKTETLGGHIPGGVSSIVFVPKNDLEQAKKIAASSEGEPAPRAHVNKWRNLLVGLFLSGAFLTSLVMAGSFGFRLGRDSASEAPVALQEGQEAEEKIAALGPTKTDANGKTYIALDQNNDGFFETRQYEDAEGRAIEQRMDENKDSKTDLIREYDENGQLTHEREDSNFDGKFDRWIEFGFAGLAVREFHDLDFDGERDMETELDERGQVKKSVTRSKGRVISEATFQNGISVRELVDLDRNGTLETELVYDQLGVLLKTKKLRP